VLRRSRLPYRTSPPNLVRAGLLSFAAGVMLTHTHTRGSRALLSLSKWCTRMFTCTHALASELPRRRGHPSRDVAELEPCDAPRFLIIVINANDQINRSNPGQTLVKPRSTWAITRKPRQ
jgi:hypothetical protein